MMDGGRAGAVGVILYAIPSYVWISLLTLITIVLVVAAVKMIRASSR